LWNASRFISPNLEKLEKPELTIVDKWILTGFSQVVEDYQKHFDKYKLSDARRDIELFFKHEFCDFYLEMVKYRIYGGNDKLKLSAKWTLYNVLLGILKLFAPFVPYITEEIYQTLFKKTQNKISIHLSSFPEKIIEDKESLEIGEILKKVISEVRKWKIGNQLSLGKEITKVEITAKKEEIDRLEKVLDDLKGTNRVKELVFKEGEFGVECFV
jgi:valyl-tRNA synthetase